MSNMCSEENWDDECWDDNPNSKPSTNTQTVSWSGGENSSWTNGEKSSSHRNTRGRDNNYGRHTNVCTTEENWDDECWDTNQNTKPQTVSWGANSDSVWRSGGKSTGQNNGRGRGNNYGRHDEKCDIIRVEHRFVGKIIGRGGSKIKELQTESGARIQVTKEGDHVEEVIKLFGSESAISKARELIKDLAQDKKSDETLHPPIKLVRAEDLPPPEEKKYVEIDWEKFMADSDKAEAELWARYPPTIKNFYNEHPEVTNMSEEEVESFRKENLNIVVDRTFENEGNLPVARPCPKFYHAFHEYPEILEEIKKAGFEKPSPIQAQAWPILLRGEDLIGIAQTGTGKTLAFLLPALIHIEGQGIDRKDRGGPAVLVMAPTRELALQIDREVKKYEYRGITSICVYGGADRKEQIRGVLEGVDIVIATPGRLNDLMNAGHLDVKTVTYAVLDEADRMLDMGFEPQIRLVMYNIRPTRQTVMTSATWPMGVRRLAHSYMKNPVQVYVGSLDLAATHTVTQTIKIIPDDEDIREATLKDFAHSLSREQKVIIFTSTKARADYISSELSLAGKRSASLHGSKDQADREQSLEDITDGTIQFLVATDLASRGLDIDDISFVVNYDFPRNIEEYVHRVGRTGRAGRTGESISFFSRKDWAHAQELINILEEAQQVVPQEVYDMADRYQGWREKTEQQRINHDGRDGRGGRGRPSRYNTSGRRY